MMGLPARSKPWWYPLPVANSVGISAAVRRDGFADLLHVWYFRSLSAARSNLPFQPTRNRLQVFSSSTSSGVSNLRSLKRASSASASLPFVAAAAAPATAFDSVSAVALKRNGLRPLAILSLPCSHLS